MPSAISKCKHNILRKLLFLPFNIHLGSFDELLKFYSTEFPDQNTITFDEYMDCLWVLIHVCCYKYYKKNYCLDFHWEGNTKAGHLAT